MGSFATLAPVSTGSVSVRQQLTNKLHILTFFTPSKVPVLCTELVVITTWTLFSLPPLVLKSPLGSKGLSIYSGLSDSKAEGGSCRIVLHTFPSAAMHVVSFIPSAPWDLRVGYTFEGVTD